MNYVRQLNGFFVRMSRDHRMTAYHISLYLALFQHWNANRFNDPFTISRTEVMELARIGSANTYARCMRELADWGYILYTASSNLHTGSRVSCIRLDTAGDTPDLTTATSGIKSGTRADTPGDTNRSGDLKNETGRNTTSHQTGSTGIKNDTSGNTGTDTLFTNQSNTNKENPDKQFPKSNSEEYENSKNQVTSFSPPAVPQEKFQVPDLSEVVRFFEQNHFPRSEAQKFYTHYQSSGWMTGDQSKIISWQAIARKWMNNTYSYQSHEREFNQVRAGQLHVPVRKNYNEPL